MAGRCCSGASSTGLSCLDYVQFSALLSDEVALEERRSRTLEDRLALEAFGHFDRDGDGFVGADELLDTLCQIGVELSRSHCLGIIEENDADGDGRLSLEEFQKTVRSVHDRDCDRGEESDSEAATQQCFTSTRLLEAPAAQLVKLAPAGASCNTSCSTAPGSCASTFATTRSSGSARSRRGAPPRRSLAEAVRKCWHATTRVF